MEDTRHSRSLYRFVTALLLAGVLLLGSGPGALAEWCLSTSKETSSECCGGDLGSASRSCAGAHFCCGKEFVASPVRVQGIETNQVSFVPADAQVQAELPALSDLGTIAVPKGRPPLLLSFAELVLQESLLSHAPPSGVI